MLYCDSHQPASHPSKMHMSFKEPLCIAGSDGPAGNEMLNIFMEYAALGSLATVIKVSNCCTQASWPHDGTALACCNMLSHPPSATDYCNCDKSPARTLSSI